MLIHRTHPNMEHPQQSQANFSPRLKEDSHTSQSLTHLLKGSAPTAKAPIHRIIVMWLLIVSKGGQ